MFSAPSRSKPCAALGRALFFILFLCLCALPVRAGSYGQNFTSGTVGTQTIGGGDASVLSSTASTITTKIVVWAQANKGLQLMGTLGGNTASWKMPDLDAGKEIQAFDATFNAGTYRASAGAVPGAGWSLNFGAIPAGNGTGEGGFVMPNGIVMAWDVFNNGGSDNPSIEVFCNGVSVGNFPSATLTDVSVPDGGTFTLTNPVSAGTTEPIAFNATAATVQAAMRLVAGWEAVTVTGGGSGPWTINHGVVGAYSDPVGDPTGIVPANSAMSVAKQVVGNATTNEQWAIAQKAYRGRAMAIHWDLNGLDVSVNGVAIFTDLPTPGFVPAIGSKFAFSARTEPTNSMELYLDDVLLATTQLQPVETGGPVISEFMADNASTLEDEDTDSPDWIEIYNGQNATVNLAGWRLTNVQGGNAMWTFPSISMAPYSYKIVYASGKNRTVATGQLHTNFTLQKGSGYLALVKPDGVTIATEFTYGAQYLDVSYGEKGPGRTLGFFQVPTPGAKVSSTALQAADGPAEDVGWSRLGGIITGPAALSITPPVAVGAVVRYTLNNSVPNPGSPVYSAPFNISSSMNIRASVFMPGRLPGAVSSRTFLLIDSSLTNYNGTGQVFSSNVPVIVFDSFGVAVDGENGTTRLDRYTYGVVIDKDPITGRASLTGLSDFQGRGSTHVHGESSAGFAQRSYNWQTWEADGQSKNVSMLGIPSGSNWVLHGPFSDKSVMRNHLVYSMMNEMRTDYMASRSRLVEVFYNQEAGQPVSYSDYRGVYTLLEKISRSTNRVNIQKLNDLTADPAMVSGGYIFKKDKADAGATSWTTSGPFSIPMQSHEPGIYTTPQFNALSTYINNFQGVLNGGTFTDPVNGYAAWIDVSTFIDGQLAVELTKQIDGYVFSTYWNKDRAGKIRAGPIWDFNIALGNANYAEGDRANGWNYDTASANSLGVGQLWYPRLHTDPWYRLRTFDRYWEWRRGVLSNTAFAARVDAEVGALCNGGDSALVTATSPTSIQSPAARHFRKYVAGYAGMGTNLLGGDYWPNPPGFATRTTYKSEIDYLKTWMTTRLTWMDNQFFSGTSIYRPPNMSSYGGSVAAGSLLTLSPYTGTAPSGFTYATGTIYYTTNGTDPRGAGGAPAGIAYTGALALNTSQTVKARLYNGGNWSPVSTAAFIVNAVPASAANLVVSELMYNPINATNAEMAAGYSTNDFEYIELLNVSTNNVDLSNVAFTGGVLFNFGTANPILLTVPPGGRVVVVGYSNAFLSRYGNNPAVKIAGAFSGSFSNGGEQITLVGATGATIAQFSYGDTEPWPVDAHGGVYNNAAPPQLIGGGYSLVLNNPAAGIDYNNGANWRSSAQVGGTPGLANGSAFAGQANGDTDGDGVKDFFEYATGSNLNNPTSLNLPVVTVAPFSLLIGTDTYLRIDYLRNLAADGVNYTVQLSENLASWASDTSTVTYVSTHNNGDGTATVTFRSTLPISSVLPQCFLRLLVSP